MQSRNVYQLEFFLSVSGGRAEENIAVVEDMVVSGRPRFWWISVVGGGGGGGMKGTAKLDNEERVDGGSRNTVSHLQIMYRA